MPDTLFETLRQIDPYVQMNDGQTVATVATRLLSLDSRDSTEYALVVDSIGRLLIYRLTARGYLIYPAVLVEQKSPAPVSVSGPRPVQFGFSWPGYV